MDTVPDWHKDRVYFHGCGTTSSKLKLLATKEGEIDSGGFAYLLTLGRKFFPTGLLSVSLQHADITGAHVLAGG